MSDLLPVAILALIQGLTEFLPISSSGHLVILPIFYSWPDQGLIFDIAVHFGTLIAVLLYFKNDIVKLLIAWISRLRGGAASCESNLVWSIIIATIPVSVSGLIFANFIESNLREPVVIATTSIIFGILLWVADAIGARRLILNDMKFMPALLIGLAQVLALIPGTSRSGITITAALLLGFTRKQAAKFSFFLAIPVILLASGWQLFQWIESGMGGDRLTLLIALLIATISAYTCIHFFFNLIEKIKLWPFALYRFCLGAVILIYYLD